MIEHQGEGRASLRVETEESFKAKLLLVTSWYLAWAQGLEVDKQGLEKLKQELPTPSCTAGASVSYPCLSCIRNSSCPVTTHTVPVGTETIFIMILFIVNVFFYKPNVNHGVWELWIKQPWGYILTLTTWWVLLLPEPALQSTCVHF